MITHRRVDVERDRDTLFELHSHANYFSSSPWVTSSNVVRAVPGPLADDATAEGVSRQPDQVAERCLAPWPSCGRWTANRRGSSMSGSPTWTGYCFTRADVYDLAVAPEFRRMGIGSRMMAFAEESARRERRPRALHRHGLGERAGAITVRQARFPGAGDRLRDAVPASRSAVAGAGDFF